MQNKPCNKQPALVYSDIKFTLFYCSIELFDTFLLEYYLILFKKYFS